MLLKYVEVFIKHESVIKKIDVDIIVSGVQKLSIAISCVFLAMIVPETTVRFLKNITTFSRKPQINPLYLHLPDQMLIKFNSNP